MLQNEVCYIKALFKDWCGYDRATIVLSSAHGYGISCTEVSHYAAPPVGWI